MASLINTRPYQPYNWLEVDPSLKASTNAANPSNKILLDPSSREFGFVADFFSQDPPINRAIGRIYVIYCEHQSEEFQEYVLALEKKKEKSSNSNVPKDYLQKTKQLTTQLNELAGRFSPFLVSNHNKNYKTQKLCKKVKLFPFWWKSANGIYSSLIDVQLHHVQEKRGSIEDNLSILPWEKKFHFINSARQAASDSKLSQYLVFVWVCFRKALTICSDVSIKDFFKNKQIQREYDVCHIPQAKDDKKNAQTVYQLCKHDQQPVCHELVVPSEQQSLIRYYVEMVVDLARSPCSDLNSFTVQDYLQILLQLIKAHFSQQDQKLSKLLQEEKLFLNSINSKATLSKEQWSLYQQVQSLLSNTKEQQIKHILLTKLQSSLKKHQQLNFSSSVGFGVLKWRQYFGEVDEEPPLPPNIEEVLNTRCSLWPNYSIKDTHYLVYIPHLVEGEFFNLKLLYKMAQNPKAGYPVMFLQFSPYIYSNRANRKPYWILITKTIAPNTQGKSHEELSALVDKINLENIHHPSGLVYYMPNVLEAAFCCVQALVSQKTHIFTLNQAQKLTGRHAEFPSAMTVCEEKGKQGNMSVGCYVSHGLNVYDSSFTNNNFGLALVSRIYS